MFDKVSELAAMYRNLAKLSEKLGDNEKASTCHRVADDLWRIMADEVNHV